MAVAAEEFAALGYAGARMDRIAELAEVNKATIYYHIGGKRKLFNAVLHDVFAGIADEGASRVQQSSGVRAQMRALGIDPDEAAARTASLSDEEIEQIAGRLDQLPAGESAIAILVGILLGILLLVVITDLLGITNAFNFIQPVTKT